MSKGQRTPECPRCLISTQIEGSNHKPYFRCPECSLIQYGDPGADWEERFHVGRFRNGCYVAGAPVPLYAWRVTTGDGRVAEAISGLLGGSQPATWEATGDDCIEVLTAAKSIDVILEGARSLRQRMILWGRGRGPFGLSGAEPRTEIFFRLTEAQDLGVFAFQTSSWAMASDLASTDVSGKLDEKSTSSATFSLEHVSFVSKNGPRAGDRVEYAKPVLALQVAG